MLYQPARMAVTLPFSVRPTFTTNMLKSPVDIQLFTSDKPPSSAYIAFGALVTSTPVTFTCLPWLIKSNQSSKAFQHTAMFLTVQWQAHSDSVL